MVHISGNVEYIYCDVCVIPGAKVDRDIYNMKNVDRDRAEAITYLIQQMGWRYTRNLMVCDICIERGKG